MFERIDFYIHDEHIEVGGKNFLLGELSADLLNIEPNEFGEICDLSKQLDDDSDQSKIKRLHSLLMQRELFQLIAKPNVLGTPMQYRQIVSDIYSFNQTIFRFIDEFLMHLKKLDTENYAAALYDFYHHPSLDKLMVNHFRDELHRFTLFDNVDVRYEPRELPDKPGNYGIYEVYSAKYLQGFLKMDFMKAIMVGHIIRRCKNCKRFFLLTQGYHTDYCDRPLADNPKRNCRNQGAKNIAKEKAENNPVIRSYNRAYQRITADKQRERITVEDWKKAKRKIRDLKDEAITGKYTDQVLEAMLQPEQLYVSLKIVRKGGR